MLDATPLLRLYAARRMKRLRRQDPVRVQHDQLLRLARRARRTRFAADHDLASIRTVADYQARVPLRRYEDFWDAYWKDAFPRLTDCTWPGTIPYFAVTSGTTTGITKYIPLSREMMRSNVRAGIDLLVHHVVSRPHSRLMGGRNFMLGGSTDLTAEAPGIHSGDLSGIAARELPRWAGARYFPPLELALIADWEVKMDVLARRALDADIRSISGTPSWLLIFFDRLAALRPGGGGRIADYFPDLELLVHGGVNFEPYRRRFEALIEGSHAELREVYPASEGFMAVADRGYGDGLRLVLDNGLFFEFVPVAELDSPAPSRHWLADVETGIDYAVALTTCAGLWSYIVGDTVRFVDLDPPRLLVTGRTSYMLSAFGEHLIDEEIEESIAAAAESIGAMISDYSVGALFPEGEGALGGHVYVVEFAEPVAGAERLAAFARDLDARLSTTNDDYRAHRAGGTGMNPPVIEPVRPGAFAAWMKSRGQLGGQHKVPRIINDQDLLANLRAFCRKF